MPMKPAFACPRCHGSSTCEHQGQTRQPNWANRVNPPARIRGRALQRIRARILTAEPWCRMCRAEGQRTFATIVDHILNLSAGGTETDANRQPICKTHHDAKTQAEATRGIRRSA